MKNQGSVDISPSAGWPLAVTAEDAAVGALIGLGAPLDEPAPYSAADFVSEPLDPQVSQADLRQVQRELAELESRLEEEIAQRRAVEDSLVKEEGLFRQLLAMHERHRQWMAYRIHDGLAQPLVAAIMNLEVVQSLLGPVSESHLAAFRRSMELLRDSLAESRRLMSGLRPPILDEFGIAAAVEHLVFELVPDGRPQVFYHCHLKDERFSPPLELALFRIVQEGLSNALRHSGSDQILIEVTQHENCVEVKVEDRGRGFDPQAVEWNRFGLEGIRERARLLGGRLLIDSLPGRGTTILAQLPLMEAPMSNWLGSGGAANAPTPRGERTT